MSDGILIMYGLLEVDDQTTGGDYTFQLPIQPLNSGFSMVLSGYQADLGQEFAAYKSRDGKTTKISVKKPAGWAAFEWIAIGRWK